MPQLHSSVFCFLLLCCSPKSSLVWPSRLAVTITNISCNLEINWWLFCPWNWYKKLLSILLSSPMTVLNLVIFQDKVISLCSPSSYHQPEIQSSVLRYKVEPLFGRGDLFFVSRSYAPMWGISMSMCFTEGLGEGRNTHISNRMLFIHIVRCFDGPYQRWPTATHKSPGYYLFCTLKAHPLFSSHTSLRNIITFFSDLI